jgi:uncharacterized protein
LPKRNRAIEKLSARIDIFIDTSAWIALFSARDQNHKDADRSFRKLINAKHNMVTTNLILAELHRLLLHRAGIRAAAVALERIEASPLVRIEFPGAVHHESAKSWIRKLYEHPISYTDAVSFAVMEISGYTEALAYDHHFHIAGFAF